MSLYDNQKCPVCGVPFKEGDDVVTCPECGTPHHRGCYAKTGKCANSDLHSGGFVYKKQPREPEYKSENANADEIPAFGAFPGRDENAPADRPQQGAPSNGYSHVPMNEPGGANNKASFVFKNNEKIDGILLSDIITAVGSNFYKFVTKFRRNKKAGWNWSAFVFGPYYLFFRKMYGPGVLFLALEFAVRIIVSFIYSKQIGAFAAGAAALIQNADVSNAEYYSQLNELIASSGIMPAYAVIAAAVFALHIIIAVFSDRLYRHKIFGLITDVDKKLENGSDFTAAPTGVLGGREMSQNDMRNLFLAGRGGVSFFAPCIAFLALSFLSDIIAYL